MTGPIEVLLYRDREGILTARVSWTEGGEQVNVRTSNWRIRDLHSAIKAAIEAEHECLP